MRTGGLSALLLLLGLAQAGAVWGAPPYKMVIVSDGAQADQRASAFVQLVKKTQPFSQMGRQLEVQIVRGDAALMKCKPGCGGIDRLVCCDDAYLARMGAAAQANRTLAWTSKANGGSGGAIPVAGGSYPPETLLHELLHTFGLGDEYEYEKSELKSYCSPPRTYGNAVSFRPRSSYSSDSEAKALHGKQIPWSGQIGTATLITTAQSLGTTPGIYAADRAALYQGGSCNKKLPSWRPYSGDTIMKTLDTALIPPVHAQVIVKRMSAERGELIRLLSLPPAGEEPRQSGGLRKDLSPSPGENRGGPARPSGAESAR